MTPLALLLFLASPAPPPPAVPAPAAISAPQQDVPPIQEEGEFYILNFAEATGVDDGINLEEFVKICQEATLQNFTYPEDTANLLRSAKVRLFGTKRIPKGDFYSFFQIMMFINQFACITVGPPHLEVTVIQSLTQNTGRQNLKNNAVYVLPDELDGYANQPATLITTVVTLDNVDVRQLATSLRPLLPDASTQSMLNAGNTNSLVLTGFGTSIYHLSKLLHIVDEASAIQDEVVPQFEVIPLEFVSADDVAELIDQLLEASRTVMDQQRGQRAAEQGVSGRVAAGQGEAEILTYPHTNSLLVMALPDAMPRIKNLVAQLDIDVPEPERNYHIYMLENVSADAISQVLDDFLQSASRVAAPGATGGRAGQPGQGGSSSDNEVVVVPDPGTNALLIAAGKTRFQEVLDLIHQLDRRQDQVLIETALIELTGNQLLDIGVELGAASIPGAGDVGGFGVTSFGLSEYVDTDGDQIPDVRAPNLLSGVTAGILDGDDFGLPVLLAAIQNRDDTNVLNIPSVLVNNNGSATVSTLDEQPTTQITTTGGVGNAQESFAGYVESGITLNISPSISASRYLRLGIELTIANFVGTFAVGTIPPPRITRTIITEVNVPDGDTMVIGGIITDESNESEESVPFLGDIPILGWLFKRQSTSTDRTTLYFFVTPHIMHDEDFADLKAISYETKLEAAEVMGLSRLQMLDPNFGVQDAAAGLEGFELPFYQSPAAGEVGSDQIGLDPIRRNELLKAAQEDQAAPDPGFTPPEPIQLEPADDPMEGATPAGQTPG